VASWLIVAVGCTEVGLKPISHSKVTIAGQFCTEGSDELVLPTKVLFAVDVTSSMGDAQGDNVWGNDPNDLREAAVRKVITEYCGNEYFSFDIVRFAEDNLGGSVGAVRPEDVTGGFVKCEEQDDIVTRFGGPLAKIKVANGWTPYTSTLQEIRRVIADDIDKMSAAEANLTSYAVIFFSDGEPCHTAQNPDGTWRIFGEDFDIILEQVEEVVALGSEVADVVVHTAFLQDEPNDICNNTWSPSIPDPEALLRTMADKGRGKFRNFKVADDIDFLELVETAVQRTYDLSFLAASNRHARLQITDDVLLLAQDSDADGLTDSREEENGTDPTRPDTDHDGCRDGLEVLRGHWPLTDIADMPPGKVDPCGDQYFSGEYIDSDHDGLYDREELLVALTDRWVADGDADGLTDGLEVMRGSKAHLNDMQIVFDLDEDGEPDIREVRANTLPNHREERYDANARDDYAYRYSKTYTGLGDNGRRCYDVKVENITLVETRDAFTVDEQPVLGSVNIIDLFFVQWLEGVTDPPSNVRAGSVSIAVPADRSQAPVVIGIPNGQLRLLR
jgi:hypothetical protein